MGRAIGNVLYSYEVPEPSIEFKGKKENIMTSVEPTQPQIEYQQPANQVKEDNVRTIVDSYNSKTFLEKLYMTYGANLFNSITDQEKNMFEYLCKRDQYREMNTQPSIVEKSEVNYTR